MVIFTQARTQAITSCKTSPTQIFVVEMPPTSNPSSLKLKLKTSKKFIDYR